MSKVVGVDIDGEVTWHAQNRGGGPDYVTLCGLDPDDPSIGHNGTVPAQRGQKIDCPQCRAVWQAVALLKLRTTDFN